MPATVSSLRTFLQKKNLPEAGLVYRLQLSVGLRQAMKTVLAGALVGKSRSIGAFFIFCGAVLALRGLFFAPTLPFYL